MERDPTQLLETELRKHDGTLFMSDDGYGHKGTVTGAVWGLEGRTFDGDDVIDWGASEVFDFGVADFSVEAWAKFSANGETLGVMNKRNPNAPNNGFYLRKSADNKITYAIKDAAGTERSTTTTNTYTDDSWYHIFGTAERRSATGLKIYINGALAGTPADPTAVGSITITGNMYVGTGQSSNAWFMKGIISVARIYTRVVSQTEIENKCQRSQWRYR